MSLTAFLKGNTVEIENIKVVVSDRFTENGKPIEWELRNLKEDIVSEIRNKSYIYNNGGRKKEKEFDSMLFTYKLCAESVVYPDLKNDELQSSYGVKNPVDLLKVMLYAGEFTRLSNAVTEINENLSENLQDNIDEVKN